MVSRLLGVTHRVTSVMFILTLDSLSVYHISQKYKNIAKFGKRLYLKLIIGYQLVKANLTKVKM